jgi:hypothetical protein
MFLSPETRERRMKEAAVRTSDVGGLVAAFLHDGF